MHARLLNPWFACTTCSEEPDMQTLRRPAPAVRGVGIRVPEDRLRSIGAATLQPALRAARAVTVAVHAEKQVIGSGRGCMNSSMVRIDWVDDHARICAIFRRRLSPPRRSSIRRSASARI